MDYLLDNPDDLYAGALLTALAIALVCEMWFPRRTDRVGVTRRWPANLGLMLVDLLVVYLVFPVSALAVAAVAADAGFGLLSWTGWPLPVVLVLGLLMMDLTRYAQHYALHRVPLCWRIHRAHHSDPACDVTTSLRFHPLESIVGVAVDLLLIALAGVPVLAVVLYRAVRAVVSTIVHANIALPPALDRRLRCVLVTPDFHRVHHSVLGAEHNSNFSGGLVWWDHLFGTYAAEPRAGHRGMSVGLPGYSDDRATSLGAILMDPALPARAQREIRPRPSARTEPSDSPHPRQRGYANE